MSCFFRKDVLVVLVAAAGSFGHAQSMYLQLTDTSSSFVTGGLSDTKNFTNTVYTPTTLTNTQASASSGYGLASSGLTASLSAGTLHAECGSMATFAPPGAEFEVNEASASAVSEQTSVDTLTVTSNTLAVGSVVQMQVMLHLDGSFSSAGPLANGVAEADISSLSNNDFALDISDNLHTVGASPFNSTVSMTYQAHVGDKITFDQSLYVSSVSQATPTYIASSETTDCSHTSQVYFQVLTAGAGFTTQSGASYTPAPVPEPCSMLGLAGGAICLLRRRKARTSRTSPIPRRRCSPC